jgi:uncharacterized RDD family membrane protein YckC
VTNQPAAADDTEFYPGQHFGLPEFGSGSVAGWSRRLVALLIDWIACSLITIAFFYHPATGSHIANVFTEPRPWTPLVFGIQDWLLTATAGFTLGKRLMGVRVMRLDGAPVGFLFAAFRTILVMMVVPTLMMDRDLRGLQDKAAHTVVVRI